MSAAYSPQAAQRPARRDGIRCRLSLLLLLLVLPWALAGQTQDKASLRKYSAKHPKEPEPYFQLGLIAAREDKNVTAIRRYFSRLEELAPDYPNPLAHYYFAIIDYTDEHYEQAVLHLQRYFDLASQSQERDVMAVYEEASNYLYWSQFLAEALLNQVPFHPQRLEGVSSGAVEMLPFLTWDGKECYYLRNIAQRSPSTFYAQAQERTVPTLCVSQRRDTLFTSGTPLSYPFNQGAPEGNVSLTADGNTMYYTRQGAQSFDIYRVERKDGQWQEAEALGPQVNEPRYWDAQPTVSADGQWLYFASNRPGGQGGTDIWRCHRLPNGDWSRAENLGPTVNTPGNEKSPFLHADGHTLYFSSDGWQGFGGYDMYFINLRSADQRPTNLGMPLNGEGDDICFGITADGTHGYYADKDIYLFELYPDARPEPMRVEACQGEKVVVRRAGADDAVYLHPQAIMLPLRERCVVARYEGDSLTIHATLTDRHGALTAEGRMALDLYASHLLAHPRLRARLEGPRSLLDYLCAQGLRPERLLHVPADKASVILIH